MRKESNRYETVAYTKFRTLPNLLDSLKTAAFTFDDLNQLESASSSDYPDNRREYEYQGNGNRESMIVDVDPNSHTVTYTYSDEDRLTGISDPVTTMTYDALGNLESVTTGSVTTAYQYNDAGHLTSINNGAVASYSYDGRNRRIQKIQAGSNRNYYYSPQGQLLSEFKGDYWDVDYVYLNGKPLAKICLHVDPMPRFLGMAMMSLPPIDPPFDPPDPGETEMFDIFWYHNDHQGTPLALTDKLQTIYWRGDYYPYGKLYAEVYTTPNDLRFPGQYQDDESNLYYNWFRYYDPTTGRYVQADPIGLNGGINLYSYVGNNPINYIDPWGLAEPSRNWWEKLEDGYYYGTGFGEQAVDHWANRYNESGNPLYVVPGLFAALWTKDTWMGTAGGLAAGGTAQVCGLSAMGPWAGALQYHLPHSFGPHQYHHVQLMVSRFFKKGVKPWTWYWSVEWYIKLLGK